MCVQKLRQDNGWSQERLAQLSGLSVRTIQRIESGKKPGFESLNCLAAVFEVDVTTLTEEQTAMDTTENQTEKTDQRQKEAEEYVSNLKAFKMNVLAFIIVIPCLYFLNISISPQFMWVQLVAACWGMSFLLHAGTMYLLYGKYGSRWEKAEIDKFMKRSS